MASTVQLEQTDTSSINEENLTAPTSYSIYWLSTNDNDVQQLQNDLQNIVNNNQLKIFENLEECEETIRLSIEKILVLIVSDSLGMQLVSRVHNLKQVSTIYVFFSNREFHLQWSKNYRKVMGVVNNADDLIRRIQKDSRYRQSLGMINFFTNNGQSQQQSHKNLKLENVTFIWQQLFIEILLRLKQKESNNNDELIDYLNQMYTDSSSQHTLEEFRHTYKATESIQWYTRPGCLFFQLNEALRKTDLQIVIRYRFFIKNLYKQLKHEHERQRKTTSSEPVHLYRGQMFSIEELEQLENGINQYVSFNSFLSTTRDREVAETFAGFDSTKSVLLDIEINKSIAKSTKPYASISHLSQVNDEEEVLFMLGTIFRVMEIKKPTNSNEIWVLKLQLANENEHYLKELYHYHQEELPRETSLTDLQPLLSEMQKSNTDKTINLTEQESSKSTLWINFIRQVVHIIKTPFGNNTTMLTKPLISLGLAYCDNCDYQLAIECFEKCLSIQNNNRCADDITRICDTLHNLGLVYKKMGNCGRALDYVNEAAFIYEQNLTSQNQDLNLAKSYMMIADLYLTLNEYDLALSFAEAKTLPIYLNIQSKTETHRLKLAQLYRFIGTTYEDKKNYDKAFDNYKQSFKIYKDIYPFHRTNDVFHHSNLEMKDITQRLLKMIETTKQTEELVLIESYYAEFNDERDQGQRMFLHRMFLSTW